MMTDKTRIRMLEGEVHRLKTRLHNIEIYRGLTDARLWTWFDFGIRAMRDMRQQLHLTDRTLHLMCFEFRDGEQMSVYSASSMEEMREKYWPEAKLRRRILISFDFGIERVMLIADPLCIGTYLYSVHFRNGQFYYFNA
jgi:hypothetical protein